MNKEELIEKYTVEELEEMLEEAQSELFGKINSQPDFCPHCGEEL